MNCSSDGLQIDFNGISSQEIVHVHVTEIADAHRLRDDVPQSRHGAEFYRGAFAQFHETLHLLGRGRGYRDQHLIDRDRC